MVVARMHHWPLEYDDAIGYGCVGLMEAAQKFDPERGWQFSTYAQNRIRGAVLDALRREDPMTRRARNAFNGHPPLKRATQRCRTDAGPSTYDFYSTLRIASMEGDRQCHDESMGLADTNPDMPDEGDEYDWPVFLATLDAREYELMQRNVLDGESLIVIARHLGISESRACQIKRRAQRKLRRLVEQQRCA